MSRVATVELLRGCNWGCATCPTRGPGLVERALSHVIADLRAARARGASTVRLTGGEPLLHRGVVQVIRQAVRLGLRDVELETNASIASLDGVAERLARAGVRRAWVAIWSTDPAAHDAVARTPGAFEAMRRGVDALRRAGIAIGWSTALRPDTAATLPELARLDEGYGLPAGPVRLWFVPEAWSASPASALAEPLRRLAARARKRRLSVALEPAAALPPCLLPHETLRVAASLFASIRRPPHGGERRFERVAACEGCAFRPRCPGMPAALVARVPSLRQHPRPDPSHFLPLAGQVGGHGGSERHAVSVVHYAEGQRRPAGPDAVLRGLQLRLEWACNQRCRFCWVDFSWTPVPLRAALDALRRGRERGIEHVAITGGEPTLVPHLADVVREARRLGYATVELQTNGTLLATGDLAERLASAGLTHALVSLHAADEALSDAITRAPGTWARTVAGIDAMVATGIVVDTSCVITPLNLDHLRDYVAFVARRWRRVGIRWAVAHPITPASLESGDGIPRLDEAGRALRGALLACKRMRVRHTNVNEECGVPPCVLDGDPRFVRPLPPGLPPTKGFIYVPACQRCTWRAVCRGVRKAYVEHFGAVGIRPLSTAPPTPPAGAAAAPRPGSTAAAEQEAKRVGPA